MNLETMRLTDAQRKSIGCVGGPLLLCAGAGSGKTFTLQQRIAYALSPESGPAVDDIDQILAITFTDKAASEIKSRVRSVLRAEGMVEQALRVDAAWISTIHGMCRRILCEHALELGIDPSFGMLDSDQEDELRTSAISTVLARCDEEGGRFDALFAEYEVTGASKSVSDLVDRLLTQAASLTGGLDAIEFLPARFASPVRLADGILVACEDALASQPTPLQRTALEFTAGLMCDFIQGDAVAQGASSEKAWAEFARVISCAERPSMQGKKAKEAIRVLLTALDQAFLEVNLRRGSRFSGQLMELARLVDAEYERLKTHAGVIDTSGLLRLALRVLDEHPSIARQYRNRFKLVMVDEFQDTNQLQIDMIERLCGQGLPNLCTVGDSQQSIYRFLGADVNVYMKHKRDMASSQVGATCLKLDKNFRSNPDVLAFVRRVCGRPGYFAEEFLDLQAGRDEGAVREKGRHFKGSGPRMNVQLTTYTTKGAGRAEAKRYEAEGIARWFSALRDAGHRAGEMVVLMGSTTHAGVYAQALRDAGFDCITEGGSGFYSAPEVKLIVRALRALANPGDTEALYALLSSEILSLSADDFLLLATRWPSPENEAAVPKRCELHEKLVSKNEPEGASPRLAFAMEVLRRAWSSLGKETPSRLLRALLVDSGYLSRKALEGADGQAQVANVLKAVRLVEGIEAQAGFDMARVARKFESLSSEKEKLGALAGDAADSVRLMTVHSSKGLEFPIVAVVDCYAVNRKGSCLEMLVSDGKAWASLMPSESVVASTVSDSYKYLKRMADANDEMGEAFAHTLAQGSDGESRVRVLKACSSGAELRAALVAYRNEESLQEKRRLFYVAATRASEAMLVACTAAQGKEGLLLEPVQEDIAGGLFGPAGFPEESCVIEYEDGYRDEATGKVDDRKWACSFDLIDADACLRLEQEAAEAAGGAAGEIAGGVAGAADAAANVAGSAAGVTSAEGGCACGATGAFEPDGGVRTVSYPTLVQPFERALSVFEPAGEGLFSYSSLAASEALRPVSRGADGDARLLADADKATDFGIAFHRLAQLDALEGEGAARGAVSRMAQLHGLTDEGRLRAALDVWLSCDVRARARSYAFIVPELAFCVPVGDAEWLTSLKPLAHFEGTMDLFCAADSPEGGGHAFIIDYKTGGSPAETPEELHEKHLLQAQCYAHAARKAGYDSVELAFVRVEQPDPENPTQPQVVTYHL